MKRFLCILLLQLLLASCADAVTPTIEPTPQVASTSTSTPVPFAPTLPELIEPRASGTADTPPEFTTGFGGEVKGISQADIDGLVAWEVYQKIYRDQKGPETWASQEDFVAAMLKFVDAKTGVDVIIQQDAGTGKLLVALVRTVGGEKSVYWDFHNDALANTNPMSLDADFSDEAGLITVSPGLTPAFRYNAVDGHWYMFGVDKDGKAVKWFSTAGTTIGNFNEKWVEVVYEPTFSYLSSSEKLGVAVQELLDNGACDVDVENPDNRMHYADGTPVPFGLLQTEKQGEGTWYYVSGVLCQGSVNVGATDSNYSEGVMPLVLIPGEKGNQIIITPFMDDDPFPQTMMFVSGPISQKSMIDTVVQKNAEIHQSTLARMARFIEAGVQNADSSLVGKQVILIFNTNTPQVVNFEKKNATIRTVLDMIAGKKSGVVDVKSLLRLLTLYIPDLGGRP